MAEEGIVQRTLDAQGEITPGTEGYWRVYGARASDIRPGDLVTFKDRDDVFREHEVAEHAPWGDIRDTVCPRFRNTQGEQFNVGALQSVAVLRRGTRHTLADSI